VADVQAVTFFADDVRKEETGKVTVIGMYGSDIRIESPTPSPFPIYAITRVIGPVTMIKFPHLVIDYLLDGVSFHALNIPYERIRQYEPAHQAEMQLLTELSPAGTLIMDATLVDGGIPIMVPLSSPLSLLAVTVDVGTGPIHAGSVPIKWTQSVSQLAPAP